MDTRGYRFQREVKGYVLIVRGYELGVMNDELRVKIVIGY